VYSTVHCCLITSGNRDQCARELGGNRGLSPLRTACRKTGELRTGECGDEAHSQNFAFVLESVVRHEESDLWPSIEPSGRTRSHKASAPNRFDF
jgi:hypothetical protein